MAVGSPIGKLFGTSPIRPLQTHMQLSNQAVAQICAMARAATEGDNKRLQSLSQGLQKTVDDALAMNQDLRQHLPRGIFMAMARPDLLELLRSQQQLAETARQLGRRVLFRPIALPQQLNKPLAALISHCESVSESVLAAINETDELLETGFGKNEARRIEQLLKVLGRSIAGNEKRADQLRMAICSAEEELGPVGSVFYYKLVDGLDDLGHCCGEIGEHLRQLLAH